MAEIKAEVAIKYVAAVINVAAIKLMDANNMYVLLNTYPHIHTLAATEMKAVEDERRNFCSSQSFTLMSSRGVFLVAVTADLFLV